MNNNFDVSYASFRNPFEDQFGDDSVKSLPPVVSSTEKKDPFFHSPKDPLKGVNFLDYQHDPFVLPESPPHINNAYLYQRTEEDATHSFFKAWNDMEYLNKLPSLEETSKNIETLKALEAKAKGGVIAPILSTIAKVFQFLKTTMDKLIITGTLVLVVGGLAAPVVGTAVLLTVGLPCLGVLAAIRLICAAAEHTFTKFHLDWTTYHYRESMKLEIGYLTDLKKWLEIDRFSLIEQRITQAISDVETAQSLNFIPPRQHDIQSLKVSQAKAKMFRTIEKELGIKNEMPLLQDLLKSLP